MWFGSPKDLSLTTDPDVFPVPEEPEGGRGSKVHATT